MSLFNEPGPKQSLPEQTTDDKSEYLPGVSWSPERKIVGAAVATLVVTAVQLVAGVELPPGVEGAVGILTAYFLPEKR